LKRGRKRKKKRVQKTGNKNAKAYINRSLGLMKFKRKNNTDEVVKQRKGVPRVKENLALIEHRKQVKDTEIFDEHQWWFLQKQTEMSYTKYPLTPRQVYSILGVKSNKELITKYRRTKKYWERKLELEVLKKAREMGKIKDKEHSASEIKNRITSTLMDLLQKSRDDEISISDAHVIKTLIEALPGIRPELLEEAEAFVGKVIDNRATEEDLDKLKDI
jgi:hypothetical protein